MISIKLCRKSVWCTDSTLSGSTRYRPLLLESALSRSKFSFEWQISSLLLSWSLLSRLEFLRSMLQGSSILQRFFTVVSFHSYTPGFGWWWLLRQLTANLLTPCQSPIRTTTMTLALMNTSIVIRTPPCLASPFDFSWLRTIWGQRFQANHFLLALETAACISKIHALDVNFVQFERNEKGLVFWAFAGILFIKNQLLGQP